MKQGTEVSEITKKALHIGDVRGSLYHPDYGYSSPRELIEKGVIVYTGLTNQGDRITSWEYKMIDGRAYIANHLMQEGSVLLLNCP